MNLTKAYQAKNFLIILRTAESLSLFYLLLISRMYVLGDDTLISKESLMRAKHIYVLIHIRNKGEVGTIEHVYALQYFY